MEQYVPSATQYVSGCSDPGVPALQTLVILAPPEFRDMDAAQANTSRFPHLCALSKQNALMLLPVDHILSTAFNFAQTRLGVLVPSSSGPDPLTPTSA